MFLIIEIDHTLSFSKELTEGLLNRCKLGQINIINIETMEGMNHPDFQEHFGEWSKIIEYEKQDKEPLSN